MHLNLLKDTNNGYKPLYYFDLDKLLEVMNDKNTLKDVDVEIVVLVKQHPKYMPLYMTSAVEHKKALK